MNPGKLRHAITLQNRVSTQNPVGGRDYNFVNIPGISNLKAMYEAKGGSMYWGGGEAHAEADCVFTIRFSTIPQPGMYILYLGVRHLVLPPYDEDGTRRWLRIPCKREK